MVTPLCGACSEWPHCTLAHINIISPLSLSFVAKIYYIFFFFLLKVPQKLLQAIDTHWIFRRPSSSSHRVEREACRCTGVWVWKRDEESRFKRALSLIPSPHSIFFLPKSLLLGQWSLFPPHPGLQAKLGTLFCPSLFFCLSLLIFFVLRAATLLHNHVLDVFLDNLLLLVVVEHRHGAEARGDTARPDASERAVTTHAVVVDDSGVEGKCWACNAGHVARTLTLTVVGVVAGRCNDPVVPADVFEIDIELTLATHTYLAVAFQATLTAASWPILLQLTHHSHQKGPVRLFSLSSSSRSHQDRRSTGISTCWAWDAQVQCTYAPFEQRLHTRCHGESVPATAFSVNCFLSHQLLPRVRLLQEQSNGDVCAGAVALWKSQEDPDIGLLHHRHLVTLFRDKEVYQTWGFTWGRKQEEGQKKTQVVS